MTDLHLVAGNPGSSNQLGMEIITGQYQDLLMKADNLPSLRRVFKQIRESVKEGDIEPAYVPYFIEGIKITVENHCCDIARNLEKKTAQAIKAECVGMVQWIASLVVDSSKEEAG